MAFSNPAGCYTQCTSDVCSAYVAANTTWDYTKIGDSSTSGSGKYVYECPSNTANPFPTSSGSTIFNENLDSLTKSINDERVRRGYVSYSFDSVTGSEEVSPGDLIYGNNASKDLMQQVKEAINEMSSGLVTYTVVDGNPVTWAQIRQARNRIDTLRSSCICNTDCGANTICSCWYDCGTNYYSDERLKEDIRSL